MTCSLEPNVQAPPVVVVVEEVVVVVVDEVVVVADAPEVVDAPRVDPIVPFPVEPALDVLAPLSFPVVPLEALDAAALVRAPVVVEEAGPDDVGPVMAVELE